jgi:RimJ/RimL family protein N-acetyltransferase
MYDGALVTLRAVADGDLAPFHSWLGDPEVTRWLDRRYPVAAGALAPLAAETSFGDIRLAVERRDTGALVGWGALHGATPENRKAVLDVVLGDRSAWGGGLGTDAVRVLCDVAFGTLGLHRVAAWVVAENAAALRVAERAGFAREGVARERAFRHGRWHDCVLVARLAP